MHFAADGALDYRGRTVNPDDIAARLPRPGPESDKYRRGVVGVLAGSDRFAGAAVLATGGAVRGGAGMVRVVTATVPAPSPTGLIQQLVGHGDVVLTDIHAGRIRGDVIRGRANLVASCLPGWPI